MEFVAIRDKLIKHFNKMTKDVDQLFEVDVDKDELWNLYLDRGKERESVKRVREVL